jgi:tetratricopeptide (TPR) repeat protein
MRVGGIVNIKRQLAAVVIAAALTPWAASAQESQLATARDLYASARYDEALALLNGIRPAEPTVGTDTKSIEQYRSLCLLALGRGEEAEAAIAAVIAVDPFYHPSETEASPRVRAAFAEVRHRHLPDIARARYTEAKQAFDRKEFQAAERQFRDLLRLIDDPDVGGKIGDMRVLVTGFHDLSVAAAAPPAAPAPVATPAAPVREEPPPPPPIPTRPANFVYSAENPGVALPITIRQDVPRVPSMITNQTRDKGIMEVVIDEQGRVIGIDMRSPLHPQYDALLLSAAREWRYRPATLDGRPVRFRKVIQIAVDKTK